MFFPSWWSPRRSAAAFSEISVRVLGFRLYRGKEHVFLSRPFTRKTVKFLTKFNLCVWRVRRIAFVERERQSISRFINTYRDISASPYPTFPPDFSAKEARREERKKLAAEKILALIKSLPSHTVSFTPTGTERVANVSGSQELVLWP